jgi:DNA-directed RNA polymerase omega subunit
MKEGLVDSLEGIDSRFRHAILAAKRAKQLVNGARKKIDTIAENPLTIALEEIRQGKINFHILEEEEAHGLPKEEAEVVEEDNEEKVIDRDLFFRPNVNSNFEEEEEEEVDEDEDEDEAADEDEDEEDEDDEDGDGDDYGDDYDDDDEEDEGIVYEGDEEDD